MMDEPAVPAESDNVDDGAAESMGGDEVRRRAGRGAALLGARTVAVRLLGLGGNIVLARLLVPRDFGVVAFGLALVDLAGFLADAGLGAALIRGRDDISRDDLAAMLGFQLLACAFVGVVVVIVAILAGSVGRLTAVMAVSLPLAALKAPGAIVSERSLSYRPLAITEVIEALIYYLWAAVTVALGAGVWGIATAVVARGVAGDASILIMVPGGRVRPRLAWAHIRGILGFGMRFQAVGLVSMVRDQAINLGTAAIAGLTPLGLWAFALSLLQAPIALFEILWRVSYPAMARLLAAGEDPGADLQQALSVLSIASSLLLALMAGTGPAVVPSLFGASWRPAVDVLPWSCLALAIGGPVSVSCAGYLYAKGDASRVLRAVILHTIAWVAVGLALLPAVGVRALGVGHLAGALVEVVVMSAGVRRHAAIRIRSALLAPIAAGVTAAAAGWTTAVAAGRSIGASALGVVVVTLTYLVLMRLVHPRGLAETYGMGKRLLRTRAPA